MRVVKIGVQSPKSKVESEMSRESSRKLKVESRKFKKSDKWKNGGQRLETQKTDDRRRMAEDGGHRAWSREQTRNNFWGTDCEMDTDTARKCSRNSEKRLGTKRLPEYQVKDALRALGRLEIEYEKE